MSTKSTKHTPGPWTYSEGFDPVISSNQGEVCILEAYHNHSEALANARLMVAAPDLLEVLEEGLWVLVSQFGETDVFVQKAYAAIAKAKGESK